MKQFFLSIAVICTLASCTQEDNAPRYSSIVDYGAAFGTSYDFQFEDASSVLNEGTCTFTNETTMVVYNDNGTAFQQEYVCVGESIRVFYDNSHWETFAFDAASMTLTAQINETVQLIIFLN